MNKFLLGSAEDFHKFVESISKNDKIRLITHTDLDGVTSAVFLNKILESKGLKVISIDFLDYGANVLKEFAENNKYDFLFLTDWNADSTPEDLDCLRKNGKVLLVDHHPLNDSLEDKSGVIKTETSYCSSHTLFDLGKKYFNTKEWEWLVCSAIIADYCFIKEENFELIKSVYPKTTKEKIWESEPGKLAIMLNNSLIYHKESIYEFFNLLSAGKINKLEGSSKIVESEINFWLEKFMKEAEYFPEKKLYFYYGNPKYRISSTIVSILSQQKDTESTLVFISDEKDKNGFVKVSSRNHTGKVDLGKLLKKCVEGFEDATAGGHPKAAAGNFPKKYIAEFKKRLIENL